MTPLLLIMPSKNFSIFRKGISLDRVVSLLLALLVVGCTSPRHPPPDALMDPAMTAHIFSEDTPAARLFTHEQRQWLIGAAYFISRNGSAFSGNDELFDFLERDLGRKLPVRRSHSVNEAGPRMFSISLASGHTMNIGVSDSRLIFTCADPVVTRIVIQSMFAASGIESTKPNSSGFGWAHALSHIFK